MANATKELAVKAIRQLDKLQRDIPLADDETKLIRECLLAARRKLPTEKAVEDDKLRKRARRAALAQ